MLLILSAAAGATELVPAVVLPTSAPVGAGSGQVALGALGEGGGTPSVAVTLRGTVGITQSLAINAVLREPDGGLLLGLRYLFDLNPHVRLAPFVFGVASDRLVEGAALEDALAAGLGIAVDAGWKSARFDLSLPLLATSADPTERPLAVALEGVSSGVSVDVSRRVRLRLAVEPEVSLGAQVTYARDRWYVQGGGWYSVLRTHPIVGLEVGLRF